MNHNAKTLLRPIIKNFPKSWYSEGGYSVYTSDKKPLQVHNLHLGADINEPEEHATLEEAIATLGKTVNGQEVVGIYRAFTEADPYFVIDIDEYPDEDAWEKYGLNAYSEESREIVEKFIRATAHTGSSAGRGLRIVGKGKIPKRLPIDNENLPRYAKNKGILEAYDCKRWASFTGHIWPGSEIEPGECQATLNWFLGSYMLDEDASDRPAVPPADTSDPDYNPVHDYVVKHLLFVQDKYAAKWNDLWADNWEKHKEYPSKSEALLALADKLVFYTNRNEDQVTRLLWESGMAEAKWDERRGSGTYFTEYVLTPAFKKIREGYNPNYHQEKRERELAELAATADLRFYPNTDAGNAERIEVMNKGEFLYNNGTGTLYWDGSRYAEDEDDARVRTAAIDTARYLFKQADLLPVDVLEGLTQTEQVKAEEERRNIHRQFARQCENIARIRAAVDLYKGLPSVRVKPDALDADPFLITTLSATVDLRTGEVKEPDRADLITKQVNATYDPDARAPKWERFLQDIFIDQDYIDYVQRYIGYAATGDTSEDVVAILYGVGANGKSTFLEVIDAVLRDYSQHTDFGTFAEKKTESVRSDLARLRGARFVYAVEGEQAQKLNEGLIKQISGGDKQTARFLFRNEITFTPRYKVFLATNYVPTIRGTDEGIWRRLRLMPFRRQFKPEEQNKRLGEEIIAEEAAGVLNWIIEGAKKWAEQGLGSCTVVDEETAKYRQDSDTLGHFLEECCEVDESYEESASDLYDAYKWWAENNGFGQFNRTRFGNYLTSRGYRSERVRRQVDGKSRKVIIRYGLRINNETISEPPKPTKAPNPHWKVPW